VLFSNEYKFPLTDDLHSLIFSQFSEIEQQNLVLVNKYWCSRINFVASQQKKKDIYDFIILIIQQLNNNPQLLRKTNGEESNEHLRVIPKLKLMAKNVFSMNFGSLSCYKISIPLFQKKLIEMLSTISGLECTKKQIISPFLFNDVITLSALHYKYSQCITDQEFNEVAIHLFCEGDCEKALEVPFQISNLAADRDKLFWSIKALGLTSQNSDYSGI